MTKRRPSFDAIDWLLVAAIVGLSAFLLAAIFEPGVLAWWNRPRAGAQVCQQYMVKLGKNAEETAVDYLLYLPRSYGGHCNEGNSPILVRPGFTGCPKLGQSPASVPAAKVGTVPKQWPLVVFLHGSGERGYDLERVRRTGLPSEIERGRYVDQFILVSPQCPEDSGWRPNLVMALIEHVCESFAVDRDRVYLTGYSMGAAGIWETACKYPDHFAAIAPLAGGGDMHQADRLKDLPIWAFHGAKDKTVPSSQTKAMLDAVRKCGGHARFTVYPDEGHSIWERTYQNPQLFEWLLAQRRHKP